MKSAHALLLLSLIASRSVGLAQSGRPVADPIQLAITQAMRDGRVADAEKLVTDAIHELEQTDPTNPRIASYLKDLSQFASRKGGPAESIAFAQRAYEIDRDAYGPSDLRLTNDLTLLASYAESSGKNDAAERYLNEALEIVGANMTNLNSDLNVSLAASVFGSVATLYITEHRFAEAEPMLEKESKLCDRFNERYRDGYAPLCASLSESRAEIYRGEGRSTEADKVPIERGRPPELNAADKIAEKFESDGLYPSAEDAYNRAVALAEKIESDPENSYGGLVMREINSLGQLFEKEGFHDRAENSYLRALAFNEERSGPGAQGSSYAGMLDFRYLVDLYNREGRFTDAETVVQRVLAIQEKSLGSRHRVIVETLMALAGIYEKEGENNKAKYEQALPLYERATAIQEANVGPNDPELLNLLQNYAALLAKEKYDSKAAEVRSRIAIISRAQQNSAQTPR